MVRQLIISSGTNVGQVFSLPPTGPVTIGRGREAQIQLNDLQVSRLHCRLETAADLLIRDTGSAGGTFVNGQRITEHTLRPGDIIRVGATELRLHELTVADQPTLPPPPAAGEPPTAVPLAKLVEPAVPDPAGPAGLTGRTLGNYEVGAFLAQGHSGIVMRGRDVRNGQDVALKILWPHLAQNQEVVQRLGRSVKTMLPVRHPNLVALYEAGQTGAYCWLAMEYIEGESLTQVIDRIGIAGMLDWRYAFRVAVHIGRALHTIHQQHIIHRNLAPQNVLIRTSDKSAVLSDVALAKAFEGDLAQQITRPGEILGDVHYQAPEQLTAGEPVDARADIYCLGAMLYALLTGRPPLAGTSLVETIALIRSVEPVRPKKFQMSIGDRFEGVVLKMLAKRREARFQTAFELLEELGLVARFQSIQVP